jgi:hypothetical protein
MAGRWERDEDQPRSRDVGLFGNTFRDQELGTFTRGVLGPWKGTMTLPGGREVEVRLPGSGQEPDPAALGLLRELPGRYAGLGVDPTDAGPRLRSLQRALAADPTSVVTWWNYGVALTDSGDLVAGTEAFRECVRRAPAYTQCLAFLALAHHWVRQYDSAAAWADSAIAVDPNYLLGRQAAGHIAVERGDFHRAVAAFDAARRIGTDVKYANSVANGALAQARAGRTGEALALLRTADSLGGAYMPNAHTAVYVAQAYAAVGEPDQAVPWLTRYVPRGDIHFRFHLRCDPPFDPLRDDARFRALLVMPSPPRGGAAEGRPDGRRPGSGRPRRGEMLPRHPRVHP